MLGNLVQDIRFALRLLTRNPGFALWAILSLALGIGANTAVFSVFDTLLLRPLPYPEPQQIVRVWGVNQQQEVDEGQVAPADYLDWRVQSKTFEHLAVYRGRSANLTEGDEPERLVTYSITASFFPLLGVKPVLGRNFTAEEDTPEGPDVLILSHKLWQRRFGGDPKIVGRTIQVDNSERLVVGVMPADFSFVADPLVEMWRPIGVGTDAPRDGHFLNAIGKVREGVAVQQAQAEMDTLTTRLEKQYPESNQGWRVRLEPLQETLVQNIRPVLVVTFGIVMLLLFISCANVANLLLARAAARQKEIAVRAALGAGRAQVIRQLLIESLVLAVVGGGLGLLLAHWGIRALVAAGPANIPRLAELGIDGRILAFTAALALVTTLLFGLVPAFQLSRMYLVDALREGGRNQSQSRTQGRLRRLLVAGEIALALVVLIAAGLLAQSFRNLTEVDPGFKPENLLTFQMVPSSNYPESGPRAAFIGEVLQRMKAIPQVKSAAEINFLPFTNNDSEDGIEIEGQAIPPGGAMPQIHFRAISPEYFRTMGIPVLRGSAFSERDLAAPRTAIINQTAARQFWPGADPVGRRIRHRSAEDWLTIAGVVGDVRHLGAASEPVPEMYVLYPIDPYNNKAIVLRTSGDPVAIANVVRSTVWSVNRNQSVFDVRPMEEVIARSLAQPRFNAVLISAFAAAGLILAALGVYAITAYSVSQRQQEIGIRMAMGAKVTDVLGLILGQGLGLAILGVAAGVAGALAATKILSSLLFGVEARDPFTFIWISLLMILVSQLASLLPAVGAARLDPVTALH